MKNLKYPKSFKNTDDLGKWLKENNIKYKGYYVFVTGDWVYTDLQGFDHLYRNGIELTAGVKAKHVFVYANGSWEYEDENYNCYLFDKDNNPI